MQFINKKKVSLLFVLLLLIFLPPLLRVPKTTTKYQGHAQVTISPLIFGTNLTLNDGNDQFITSSQTRSLLQSIHVQIIRTPIRAVGAPSPWEVTAIQDIHAMNAVPLVVLKFSQSNLSQATQSVIQAMNNATGTNTPIYYEFGNERDLAGVDQVTYTNTWNQVIPQVKSLNPNAKFGGPANFQSNPSYIAYFVHNANPKPDYISWHEYTCGNGQDPQAVCIGHIANWKTHIANTKAAIQANGDSVPPIFITEWNYDPNNPNPDSRATAQFQQQFTQTALNELANDGVTAATHYVATGHQYYNLIDPNTTLTPEGQMFGQMFTQLIGNMGGLTPRVTQLISSSPTQRGNSIAFSVTICPHGFGNCGDNINPKGNGNTNPLHQQRNTILSFYDNNNHLVTTLQGTISYASENFTGNITGNITNGSYIIKIKSDGFLQKQFPGIITVSNQQITLPVLSLVNGDVNNDNQLDILDYNAIVSCFGTKQNTATCSLPPSATSTGADITDDGKVDGSDYNLFLRELSVQTGF